MVLSHLHRVLGCAAMPSGCRDYPGTLNKASALWSARGNDGASDGLRCAASTVHRSYGTATGGKLLDPSVVYSGIGSTPCPPMPLNWVGVSSMAVISGTLGSATRMTRPTTPH